MKVTEMGDRQQTLSGALSDICENIASAVAAAIELSGGEIKLNYTGRSAPHPFAAINSNLALLYNKATALVLGGKPDRHKLAACVCGSVMHAKPLVRVGDFGGKDQRFNYLVAMAASTDIIESYMVAQYLAENGYEAEKCAIEKLCGSFEIRLPRIEENTCDKKSYETNLKNALVFSAKKKIDDFDILAYAKIFYHLEHCSLEPLREYMESKGYQPQKPG
ncbi:MAG: hypothetical protein LBI54_05675 [Lachnospiraceae bacterium]|jgi:hypothetical protein|nr:hypothetical protein [Lachnospiraceae bacterium]